MTYLKQSSNYASIASGVFRSSSARHWCIKLWATQYLLKEYTCKLELTSRMWGCYIVLRHTSNHATYYTFLHSFFDIWRCIVIVSCNYQQLYNLPNQKYIASYSPQQHEVDCYKVLVLALSIKTVPTQYLWSQGNVKCFIHCNKVGGEPRNPLPPKIYIPPPSQNK